MKKSKFTKTLYAILAIGVSAFAMSWGVSTSASSNPFYVQVAQAGDCGLKKGCFWNSGCKDVVGGCCLGPAQCGS